MFIYIIWKDPPELSTFRRKTSTTSMDESGEKSLLVNPQCPVRILLEFIRKRCKLGTFTEFDLCDESGGVLGLFNLPTYMYATDLFVHKRTYYIIVLKAEPDSKQVTILPQLNCSNPLYELLHDRVRRFMATGDVTPVTTTTPQVQSAPSRSLKSAVKKKA